MKRPKKPGNGRDCRLVIGMNRDGGLYLVAINRIPLTPGVEYVLDCTIREVREVQRRKGEK